MKGTVVDRLKKIKNRTRENKSGLSNFLTIRGKQRNKGTRIQKKGKHT